MSLYVRLQRTWDSLRAVVQELSEVLDHLGLRRDAGFRDAKANVLEGRQLGGQSHERSTSLRIAQRSNGCKAIIIA